MPRMVAGPSAGASPRPPINGRVLALAAIGTAGGSLQRPVRRRRGDRDRAAAGAVARLRGADGDRHLARRDRLHRRVRGRGRRALRQRARARRGARRACPRSPACCSARGCSSASPAGRSRCCSPPCSSRAPWSWCCGDRRDRDRPRRRGRRRPARRRRRRAVRARARDLPRPRPAPRRGDLAAGDRAGGDRRHATQDRYGNVCRHDALLLGLLSIAGAAAGVALANALSGAVLRDAFAVLMVLVAAQLVRRTLTEPREEPRARSSAQAFSL